MVRDDSATYFFELLFVTRFLTDFIEGFALEQSSIERVCSFHNISSRRQRHLFFFKLLFVTRFAYRFCKGVCHRAIHDRESVFTPYYWFAMTAPPIFPDYYWLRVFLTDFVKGFAIEQSAIERVCSFYVIGSRQQRHLFVQIIICYAFSYRFCKGIYHRAILDRESMFTPCYWFATTALPKIQCYYLFKFNNRK